jgi:excisionase family DNA binding protein
MPVELHDDVHRAPVTGTTSLLDELMTARQIADVLQMRVSTIESYARRGLLPSIKLGRHRRFVRSRVEEAIAQLAAL